MASLEWPPKDPNETLDYSIDWTDRLNSGDPVQSAVWTFPAGITQAAPQVASPLTSVRVSGGSDGASYLIGCQITTAAGLVMEETVNLPVRSR